MVNIFSKVLHFEDAEGELVEVRTPSVVKSEEFRHRYNDFIKMSKEKGIAELRFDKAYGAVKKYRRLINNLLNGVGIDPQVLTMDMIGQLLFPHETLDEDGKIVYQVQGALLEFIFGPPDGDPEESSIKKEELDSAAKIIGELWALTEDFAETLQLVNTLSIEDINSIVSVRNDALKPPEQKVKDKQIEGSKKLMENLKAGKVLKEDQGKSVQLSEEEMSKFIV